MTVGGNVRDRGGNVHNSEEIKYALKTLRLEDEFTTLHRLLLRIYGMTCKKPIKI